MAMGQGMDSQYPCAKVPLHTISGVQSFMIICFGGAFLLAVIAVRHQCADFIPHHGNSMGGEILDLLLWVLASLLAAAGCCAFIQWYFAALVFIGLLAFSFLVRYRIDSWERRRDEKRVR